MTHTVQEANMEFYYELEHTEGMTESEIEAAEKALESGLYVCQQEFEKAMDMYHAINLVMDAEDEATVTKIEIDGDEVNVTLDCSKVKS